MNIASLALGCALVAQAAEPPRRYPGAEAAENEASSAPPFERTPAKSGDPFEGASKRDAGAATPESATTPPPAKTKSKAAPPKALPNPLRRDTAPAAVPAEREPPAKRIELPAASTRPAVEAARDSEDLGATQAEGQPPKVSAKDLIAGLVVAPAGQGLEGEPLRLADAFVRSRRFPPADVAQAYWALAAATAEYHQRRGEAEELEVLGRTVSGAAGEPAELKASRGAARAALAESKLAALAAQQRLAGFTGHAPPKLPVVADFPHTGTYQTLFEEIFAGRAAPAEMALLHRMLPLEREALLARAQSALAALDDLEATMAEIDSGRGDLRRGLTALAEHGRQMRALVRAAEQYNRDIARYAMQAAPPGLDPLRMAGMLIRQPTAPTKPTAPVLAAPPGVIRRAENVTPADSDGLDRQVRPAGGIEPEDADDEDWRPSTPGAGEIPAPDTRPTIRSIYVPKAGATKNEGVIPAADVTEPLPREAPSADPRQGANGAGPTFYRAQRPRTGGPGLYSGLVDAPAVEQAASLAGLLVGHPSANEAARLVSLEECQAMAPGRDRRQLQVSYGRASALAARCEILAATQVQLVELGAASGRSAAPHAMLAVRSAAARCTADLAGLRAELLAARWALTQAAGQNLASAWLFPSRGLTTPDWLAQKEGADQKSAQPPRDRDQRALFRTAITQRAAAAVAADTVRAAHVEQWQSGKEPVDLALRATADQLEATLAFVAALARLHEAHPAGG